MKHNNTAGERFAEMTNAPVPRLICNLAIPTIVSMLVTSVYNMADTFFVSQIGTSASGAVGVAFSLMAIIQAIGFTLGSGSGNYISRLLGQKNEKHAAKVAATGFFTALGLGAILALLGLLFLEPLVYILGATDTIAPYAKAYIGYILIGAPYMAASFVLNNVLRYQGRAFFAMLGIGIGGVLNIVLDPIFIFVLGLGTAGAAIATIISQFIGFCILYVYSGSDGNIKIRFKNFTPRWGVYKEILRGGLPSFYRQALASFSMILLNQNAGAYGDAAIAAMAIVTKTFQFAISALIGFGQGFQPVCGFNYGAKLYDRVREAFWFCIKIAAIVMVAIAILGFTFSEEIITLFRRDDLEVIIIGSRALRFQCIAFPLSAWIIMTNMMLQTMGKGTQASIVAISRQGLFFMPAVLILPRLFGITGIQMSQPVADMFSFIVAVPLGIITLRELKIGQQEQGKGQIKCAIQD